MLAVALLPGILVFARTAPNLLLRPRGIVVHHSAMGSDSADAEADVAGLDAAHAKRGFAAFYWGRTYHIGYHYVIHADGRVEGGRPEHCVGAHTIGFNDRIGICLLGNFENRPPTRAQMDALVRLCRTLRARYDIGLDAIAGHGDCTHKTACPGRRFPLYTLKSRLE